MYSETSRTPKTELSAKIVSAQKTISLKSSIFVWLDSEYASNIHGLIVVGKFPSTFEMMQISLNFERILMSMASLCTRIVSFSLKFNYLTLCQLIYQGFFCLFCFFFPFFVFVIIIFFFFRSERDFLFFNLFTFPIFCEKHFKLPIIILSMLDHSTYFFSKLTIGMNEY